MTTSAPRSVPGTLRPGDLVAVVQPSGPVDAVALAAGTARLREWGLQVQAPQPLEPAEATWLAGSDRSRATALQAAWCDPDVAAVWTTRGGYGAHRLLDLLDRDALATAGPKLLVGFSDVTVLHQAWAAWLGVPTVHGPGVATLGRIDAAEAQLTRSLLMEGAAPTLDGRVLVPGPAVSGPLVGGNVTVLASSAGTPGVRPAAGSIALLEDVGEYPYRLDRALTQLRRSGWLDGVRGIVCGRFTDCGSPEQAAVLLHERLGDLGVPVLVDVPVGHESPNQPVLLGLDARLDGSRVTCGRLGA